ncbi:uncharacterized protein RCO7_02595 [Rhynchosporium graminicola]|uniref:FAD-binding domain-containing protein n=1 Tax=Rhynchosporium graminicola TaxID=2792576 RepID=A0A1E1KFF1_9HELO|nr:uncharacterized protein RCO7_02595 [Rhynchosporium commune]
MANHQSQCNFKAIIIGGSVAGLTFAHMFERANINYILLEARYRISPSEAASIVIMPNGARILDQLGYINGICERRIFLRSIFDQLKDKSRVKTGKRVMSIEDGESSVTVLARMSTDSWAILSLEQMEYIVELDSRCRSLQRRSPRLLNKDKNMSRARYYPDPMRQTHNMRHRPFRTPVRRQGPPPPMVLLLQDARRQGPPPPMVLLLQDARRHIGASNIPRFANGDMEAQGAQYSDFHLTENFMLNQLMVTSDTFPYFPLEEASHEVLKFGSLVCVGDAVHKMTPNMGQGGNQAIENAGATQGGRRWVENADRGDRGNVDKFSGVETAACEDGAKVRDQYLSTELFRSSPSLNVLPQPSRTAGNRFWAEDDADVTTQSSNLPPMRPSKARLHNLRDVRGYPYFALPGKGKLCAPAAIPSFPRALLIMHELLQRSDCITKAPPPPRSSIYIFRVYFGSLSLQIPISLLFSFLSVALSRPYFVLKVLEM